MGKLPTLTTSVVPQPVRPEKEARRSAPQAKKERGPQPPFLPDPDRPYGRSLISTYFEGYTGPI